MYPLVSVLFELTTRCNLRCLHCGSTSGPSRAGELSVPRWLELVDECRALGCEEIGLLGGEVLLVDGWERIAARITEAGMRLIVITNGLLVDDEVLATLVALDPYIVAVSVDGATRETFAKVRGADRFDQAMAVLDRLEGSPLSAVTLITTFHRLNLDAFPHFLPLVAGRRLTWQVQIAGRGGGRFGDDLFLRPEDFDRLAEYVAHTMATRPDVRLVTMDDLGYLPHDPRLASLHEWQGCQAGRVLLGIRSNGEVVPCLSLGDEAVVGSVEARPLRAIWEDDEVLAPYRRRVDYLHGRCAACDVRHRCEGGCPDMARSVSGSLHGDPYCIRQRERDRVMRLVGCPS